MPPQAPQRHWLLSPPGILLSIAVLSGGVAWWLVALPVLTLSNARSHSTHFPHVFVHAVSGTVMLVIGAINLYLGATRQFFSLHRPLGLAYLLGGSISAVSAIVLALGNGHRKPSIEFAVEPLRSNDLGWALATLGAAWLVCAAMGYRAALNRRFPSHQAWMTRSYVLVWSFVLCRLIGEIPSFPQLGSGGAIAWLSWTVPLMVCEVALQWHSGRRQ
jgi:Predicted membrane protein (DUF2306)